MKKIARENTIITSLSGQAQKRPVIQRNKQLQRATGVKPMRVRKRQRGRSSGLTPLRHVIINRSRPAKELWPQRKRMKLFRSRDHKHAQDLMFLQVGKLNTTRQDLLLEIQPQRDIILRMLDPPLGQVDAVDLQHPVVVDHPPPVHSRIHLAVAEVDRPLGREKAFRKGIFVLGDRLILLCGCGRSH